MLNTPADKYHPYPTVSLPDRRWPEQRITHAPRWLSTDLRDGNQALAEPMDSARKLQFWDLLLSCGFKEIEVAFPSASQTDFNFVRQLIEENRIPDDVTIQVLTQAREDLILRTFESLRGAKQATVHLYNATAPLFRRLVFGMEKTHVVELATRSTRLIRQLCEANPETRWQYEYSPETFCFTEPEFALEICEAVADIWQPCAERPMVINLPATVEVNTPNVYADQIEYFCRHFSRRRDVCISVHPHNDRGTGVASAELAVMAGADRVEGCLFGNGERTGNVCLVTLAMNLYSQGVSPNLDFSEMARVVEVVENCNQLPVHPRHPWAGRLAYTAFSGSHQDAIKKGFDARKPDARWEMPYLPVDPQDIGCTYEAVIRVNSQSGKSGSAWLIEQNHGLKLPRALQQDFSQHVQQETDRHGKEMTQNALWQLFRSRYGLVATPRFALQSYRSDSEQDGQLRLTASILTEGGTRQLDGQGNGLLSAAANGLSRWINAPFAIKDYHEHTLGERSDSRSVAYIRCLFQDGSSRWGVGIDSDVARASLQALLNAVG
ncbi:2-isopropylmalate synthase [Enterobacter cancerogenus]|uniref:2-isopropylmalate synthase n=1 Tax=Enterobacter cancerogenus TaxID=69218 RepID=UPI0007342F33|nr:2-isopropylmalate synthase [Enterobacter cancerogenus]KTQ50854.1 2-isopropylmalate synthase [Enterobacter cancerogenus]KTQ52834.1 2-isopropylmalate synthase [Enterobacter cancerogenus]KTQ75217.1 2-isopropylmalate synthase [Enterobacter cancerogenus]KTQ80749.1 2-isopropylmalate synthase [Enterobacter cancerogenus]MDT7009180.1 2-isopropylmalate synthase [Enterobacter cancerogenus]